MGSYKIQNLVEYIKVLFNITNSLDKIFKIKMEHDKKTIDRLSHFLEEMDLSAFDKERCLFHQRFLENTDELINYCQSGQASIRFFYRGQKDKRYALLPSVMRGEKDKEDFLYKEIITRCPNFFAGRSHLQMLVEMQHYDCPTRLLDVTTNPLVALFFACFDFNNQIEDNNEIGEVLVFAPTEKEVLSYDSDKALILSSLPKFNKNEKNKLFHICLKKALSGEKLLALDSQEIEKLYHEIKKERPAFKENISPIDLLKSYLVEPLKDNERILKQEGAFIISGLYSDETNISSALNDMVIAHIEVLDKKNILKELNVLGINEACLFPELDHVAHFLKNRQM